MIQTANSVLKGTATTSDFGDLTARDALTEILQTGAQRLRLRGQSRR